MSYVNQIKEAVAYLQQQYSKPIETGIVLGTGLGGLAREIIAEKVIDYSEIPHFPLSTVEGHKGKKGASGSHSSDYKVFIVNELGVK